VHLADNAQGTALGFVSGGVITFGGGVALYPESQGPVIGELGVSGDTSCADHAIAYRVRERLHLNNTPAPGQEWPPPTLRRRIAGPTALRTKNSLDTSIPPTTYNEGHKQANQTAGGIGTDRCRVGSAISALWSANAPLRCLG
jgi:hypothetical protein